MNNQKGVSLIILVITIIVVIVLAAITMQTTSDVPDEAHYTEYVQEMKNVQTAVDSAKLRNARKGTTEEKLTEGFKKVYLENAPAQFVSFGDYYEPVSGYVVSMQTIGYDAPKFGNAYKPYYETDEIQTITFGDTNYDVYVFDADWTVYYVKGLKYDGSMNYTFK